MRVALVPPLEDCIEGATHRAHCSRIGHRARRQADRHTILKNEHLQQVIESRLREPRRISPSTADAEVRDAVEQAIAQLDSGSCAWRRKRDSTWITHQWIKKAVLLSFRSRGQPVDAATATTATTSTRCRRNSPTMAEATSPRAAFVWCRRRRRAAALIARRVLMPSYVNIGAYVDEGTMVDTWATVGSCAQIGKNVHLSGGVGIGGVLEPLQANPTIIEDNCFIGARSEIVEGVIVEESSVISMGVYIGQSTRIYDRDTGEITYGRFRRARWWFRATCRPRTASTASIVQSSSSGRCQTRAKTSINELLRGD